MDDSRDCPSFVPKDTKGDCPESSLTIFLNKFNVK